MISEIKVKNVASYIDEVEVNPNKINYLFGSNGSGKTSLTNVLKNNGQIGNCSINWKTVTQPEFQVYNRDFVKENFSQSETIKGIFTLGKDSVEAKTFINDKKQEINKLSIEIEGNSKTIKKKETELNDLYEEIITSCWEIKNEYEEYFRPAYTGFIASRKSFFHKCLAEQSNKSSLNSKDEIIEKCTQIFSNSLRLYEDNYLFELNEIKVIENHEILKTKIIGKEDIPIGELISKLENSDWVKTGVSYLPISKELCPFCQQKINDELKNNLEIFFDENYETQCNLLDNFNSRYCGYFKGKIEELNNILSKEVEILNYSELDSLVKVIVEKFKNNVQILKSKINSPSLLIELESLEEYFLKAQNIVNTFGELIQKNNNTFNNLVQNKRDLNGQIWRFIVSELSNDFVKFQGRKI